LVQELFKRLYQRRVLVRLIGVRFSSLVGGAHQLQLFDQELAYPALYQALDRIRLRYGDRAVLRAIGLEARSIGHYNPFDGEPPILLANRSV
jgi:DNA polymerase-4